MRIIAGEHGGRRIRAPEGEGTRPMLDRVREALFSTLQDWMDGARVLDLFAGSGSLGLESLSRGAQAARLIESDRAALELLRANVAELGLAERAELVRSDALEPRNWAGGKLLGADVRYDLIFLDPPYRLVEDRATQGSVLAAAERLARERLATAGRIVLHVPRSALLDGQFSDALAPTLREYGTNALWYLAARAEGTRR